MPKTIISRYDVAEHLRTTEDMVAYLNACIEEADGDAAFMVKALGDIARAHGMSQIARDTCPGHMPGARSSRRRVNQNSGLRR